ncbi:MAG: hypothetical protein CSB55_02655 [Candidatus Cloacimonadota bacterium]|nr:MAG: hypothetical protein CSB55_02655 [Candidatus Cloacimonadota bacterium]
MQKDMINKKRYSSFKSYIFLKYLHSYFVIFISPQKKPVKLHTSSLKHFATGIIFLTVFFNCFR